MNLRKLEPVAGVVVNGIAIAASVGLWSYAMARGGWLKLKDALL